jgi:hypothetical protein
MKRIILLIVSVMLSVCFLYASDGFPGKDPDLQKRGKTIEAFVPAGWKLISRGTGDLNGDALDDIVGVIECTKPMSSPDEAPPRILFIAFRRGSSYELSIQSDSAIMKADEGGVFGDPFSALKVENGTLLISFYGGSAWRWSCEYRFKYLGKSWRLIAVSSGSYEPSGAMITRDHNLLTGQVKTFRKDENGKESEEQRDAGEKELPRLKDFNASSGCE